MNVLLLGATGYLGTNLAQKLVSCGHKVICVVRFKSDISKINNLGMDIISNEPAEMDLAFKTKKIDWVINAVCAYKYNDTLYADMLEANVIFPLSVLNLSLKYDVNNFLTLGTSLPDRLNMYSFTKSKFSEFGDFFCNDNNFNFGDLKLEMFYGGISEPSNRFISSVREKLRKNEDIPLTLGTQKRDLIRVEDIVEIIIRLIESDYIKGYQKLPIGSGEQHSIKEIVNFMRDNLGSESKLLFGAIESREGEPDTLADISWYKDINYSLQYSYWEGLYKECKC